MAVPRTKSNGALSRAEKTLELGKWPLVKMTPWVVSKARQAMYMPCIL